MFLTRVVTSVTKNWAKTILIYMYVKKFCTFFCPGGDIGEELYSSMELWVMHTWDHHFPYKTLKFGKTLLIYTLETLLTLQSHIDLHQAKVHHSDVCGKDQSYSILEDRAPFLAIYWIHRSVNPREKKKKLFAWNLVIWFFNKIIKLTIKIV